LRNPAKPVALVASSPLANIEPCDRSVSDSAPAQEGSGSAPDPDHLAEGAAPAENQDMEVPAIESSWARELRELKALASRDPVAALEQVAGMADKEEREAATKEICLELAPKDPALAMDAAWNLELGKDGGLAERAALENIARQWATADLSTALAWANAQPADDEGRRDQIMKGITVILSRTAPADAARLVAEQMSSNHEQYDAAMTVVSQWAVLDFTGAAEWVSLFPEGPTQDQGLEELTKAVSGREQPSVNPLK